MQWIMLLNDSRCGRSPEAMHTSRVGHRLALGVGNRVILLVLGRAGAVDVFRARRPERQDDASGEGWLGNERCARRRSGDRPQRARWVGASSISSELLAQCMEPPPERRRNSVLIGCHLSAPRVDGATYASIRTDRVRAAGRACFARAA